MKAKVLVGVLLLALVASLSAGCAEIVTEEDFEELEDRVVDLERDSDDLKTQVGNLTATIEELEVQVGNLTARLDAL